MDQSEPAVEPYVMVVHGDEDTEVAFSHGVGAVQADPGFESSRFQSLILKRM